MTSLNEFEIISDIFRPLTKGCSRSFDLQDDAAIVRVPKGHDLVVTKDAMVADVHFLETDPPESVGRKLLRVNLSDLAAKGARPLSYALACAWPHDLGMSWIEKFVHGLLIDQTEFDLYLLGGDTVSTRGAMTLSLTAFGVVRLGKFIERKGAQPGDDVWVTGTVGDAAMGLELLRGRRSVNDEEHRRFLQSRYRLPEPRLSVGRRLMDVATSCIDVSDGLAADAGHIAERSKVKLVIETNSVPVSDAARACAADIVSLIGAGDDYELLFTAPPAKRDRIVELADETRIAISTIGRVEDGEGVTVVDEKGSPVAVSRAGFRHFDQGRVF